MRGAMAPVALLLAAASVLLSAFLFAREEGVRRDVDVLSQSRIEETRRTDALVCERQNVALAAVRKNSDVLLGLVEGVAEHEPGEERATPRERMLFNRAIADLKVQLERLKPLNCAALPTRRK